MVVGFLTARVVLVECGSRVPCAVGGLAGLLSAVSSPERPRAFLGRGLPRGT